MNNKLIELNVDFKYANEPQNVLSGIKGSIDRGRCVCFCGESGCGVTDTGTIGVDTEKLITHCEELADSVLSEKEKYQFRRCSNKERYFTEIWTKKEAYLKMLGTGINDEIFKADTMIFDDKTSGILLSAHWHNDICTAVCSHSEIISQEISIAELIKGFEININISSLSTRSSTINQLNRICFLQLFYQLLTLYKSFATTPQNKRTIVIIG